MERIAVLEAASSGISPDRARADYLARRLEEIRAAMAGAGPDMTPDEVIATIRNLRTLLRKIPRQA